MSKDARKSKELAPLEPQEVEHKAPKVRKPRNKGIKLSDLNSMEELKEMLLEPEPENTIIEPKESAPEPTSDLKTPKKRVVHSLRMAGYIMYQGIPVLQISIDKNDPTKKVFFFNDTKLFNEKMTEYLKIHPKKIKQVM